MSNLNSESKNEDVTSKIFNGLLVTFKDDQLDECVKLALKKKSRVKYKCMDSFSNMLAFGASSGATYLFRLESVTHTSCSLMSIIPCDQGSIEVIKFLPNPRADHLLVVIGTTRGSVVVFRLAQLPTEQNPVCNEIYKAENFTNNFSIKIIEYDQDLLDPACSFTKLYICDSANRLYILESSSIYATKQSLRLFYNNHLPSLIFSANDSKINQINVNRSEILISTDETTRLFNEQSNHLSIIGKKRRKEGFYGACFFSSQYKPIKVLQMGQLERDLMVGTSTNSMYEMENLLIFVSRPMFRLWQVNNQRQVMFTHQFEPVIKSQHHCSVIELLNEPVSNPADDDPTAMINDFISHNRHQAKSYEHIKSDHFQKLVPIYSSTLGNLLLSYTKNEIFIVDPIGAELIVSYHQEASIVEVCCNESEIFVWSLTQEDDQNNHNFHLKRFVLLAPTQFILELHRLHKYNSLIMVVENFSDFWRARMALPLSGSGVITTEGGLLRNILLHSWDMYASQAGGGTIDEESCQECKSIVEAIIDESKQMKQSFENLTDSRFLLSVTNENIDRLCSEPYASLVSLDVSIVDLHTNHVIHFNKDTIDRHKSVSNLPRSLRGLNLANTSVVSQIDLRQPNLARFNDSLNSEQAESVDKKVIVERQKPKRVRSHQGSDKMSGPYTINDAAISSRVEQPFFSIKEYATKSSEDEMNKNLIEEGDQLDSKPENVVNQTRCTSCHWPRPGSHKIPIDSSQQIQLNWIEDKLLGDFEENVDQICERAFKHGLWRLYLKCLAFKNQLDDYITCCLVLDDVKLLDIDHLLRSRTDLEILDRLLTHLRRKVDLVVEDAEGLEQNSNVCLKCGSVKMDKLQTEGLADSDQEIDDIVSSRNPQEENESSFNLVNLTEKFIVRRDADVKKIIGILLEHPQLLNKSKIPTMFYLRAIKIVTLIANQSTLSRARLNFLLKAAP